jgi:cellulose synthase/poly-beta-1,6-N-acetylglucosamine synthase-like glycosyltransferase
LQKIVIVASDCPSETISALSRLQREDSRIELVVEEKRQGKADAVNKILARTKTPLVLFANSDSRPHPGAIAKLLSSMESGERIGAVSAIPEPEAGRGLMPLLLGFMWSAHNNCSIALNHMNISNHSCDELVLFRTRAITFLPPHTVNDGAFLAAAARLRGYSIKVSTDAKVRIRTPTRISDVILQRRRILFGHAQVWRQIGTPPKTIESLLFLSPPIGIRLLVSTLASRPRSFVILPVAFVSEMLAGLLSISDVLRSSKSHAIWKRFD